jgi:hypothetical protein
VNPKLINEERNRTMRKFLLTLVLSVFLPIQSMAASYVADVNWGITGLTGSIYFQVKDAAGTALVSRTTTGVAEAPAGSGIYEATFTVTTAVFPLKVTWDNGTDYARGLVYSDGTIGVNSTLSQLSNTVQRGATGQGVYIYAKTSADAPDTGDAANITALISKDGGGTVATTTVHPTEMGGGVYWLPLSNVETRVHNTILIVPSSTTAGVTINPVVPALSGNYPAS